MSLLPPNASAVEKALSDISCKLFDTPFDLSRLINPASCPSALLPFLAWTVSVDEWSDELTEREQRKSIASSIEVHKKKGTKHAILVAIDALGYPITFTEWFEQTPIGKPYTFSIQIDAQNKPLLASNSQQLVRVINQTKNARSHLAAITVFTRSSASLGLSAFYQSGSTTLIGPWLPGSIKSTGHSALGCTLSSISKTRIPGVIS